VLGVMGEEAGEGGRLWTAGRVATAVKMQGDLSPCALRSQTKMILGISWNGKAVFRRSIFDRHQWVRGALR